MRSDNEVLEAVVSWGKENKDVRTILLTGSRANPAARVDLFSDYDIELVVNNPNLYLNNEAWLTAFGEPLAIIRVDETFYLRMITYTNYVRIDFRVYSLKEFKHAAELVKVPPNWDIGYRVLLDKDGLTNTMKPPTHTSYIITKPIEEEFLAVITDFWWDTVYVAKSLWREELFYAKYMLDNIIRFSYLQKMIEWYIGMQHNWQVTTNKNGRYFKKYLDKKTWTALENTFCGSDIAQNWDALFQTLHLFRKLATMLATAMNYTYPYQLDNNITRYLQKIKNTDRSVTDIT